MSHHVDTNARGRRRTASVMPGRAVPARGSGRERRRTVRGRPAASRTLRDRRGTQSRRDRRASARRARRAWPQRGLEAALLLADVEVKGRRRVGRGAHARDRRARLPRRRRRRAQLLARGWLRSRCGDGAAALRHFELVPASYDERPSRELAVLGTGWARLVGPPGGPRYRTSWVSLASSAQDPTLRIGALPRWRRRIQARGEHRRLAVPARAAPSRPGTSFADDVELRVGLAQLDMGRAATARRMLEHRRGRSCRRSQRHGPERFDARRPATAAGRVRGAPAALYAGQVQPGIDLR